MSDMRRIGIGPSFTIDVSESVIAQEGIDEVRRQVRRIYEAAHQKRMDLKKLKQREQFEKRHKRVVDKLEAAAENTFPATK